VWQDLQEKTLGKPSNRRANKTKIILRNYYCKVRSGLIWLWIKTNGGIVWKQKLCSDIIKGGKSIDQVGN
jgi:hypothetical protein